MTAYNLIRPLSDKDKICFRCRLPECDQNDPRCAFYRDRTKTPQLSHWQWLYDALDGIEPGETRLIPLNGAKPARIQNHLYCYAVPPDGYKFTTRTRGSNLAVWLKEAIRRRRG